MQPGLDIPGDPESEGRFTAPTELCPRPERWTSTDGDSTEVEVSDLAWGLVRALQPNLCLETGSGFGQTTRRIREALNQNGHGGLIAIENDEDRALRLLGDDSLGDTLVVFQDSLTWTPTDGTVIDFAWLDSWYEFRVPEFLRYRPWMRAGSVVCFHDTAPEHGSHRISSGRDLRTDIEAQLGAIVRLIHLPTPRGVTITEVR